MFHPILAENIHLITLYTTFLNAVLALLTCSNEQWLHYTLLHMHISILSPMFVLWPALFAWLEVGIIEGSDNRGWDNYNRGSDNQSWTVLLFVYSLAQSSLLLQFTLLLFILVCVYFLSSTTRVFLHRAKKGNLPSLYGCLPPAPSYFLGYMYICTQSSSTHP